jgi:hypothetical protein
MVSARRGYGFYLVKRAKLRAVLPVLFVLEQVMSEFRKRALSECVTECKSESASKSG